uniref:PAP-associated domain-containing protein n=1 Tax=Parastrongyloides trichosuri TaxID=131310 RepID=A0A0N4ZV76_PARTI
MNLNLQSTTIQFNSTNTTQNIFDNRNNGSDSGMHTNSTSSASSNDGDPKRLESLSSVTIQNSAPGRGGAYYKASNRRYNRTNRKHKEFRPSLIDDFYNYLNVSDDLKHQLLYGFRDDIIIPHCHLGLPPLPIQPPLLHNYLETIEKAKEIISQNDYIIQYPKIEDSLYVNSKYITKTDEKNISQIQSCQLDCQQEKTKKSSYQQNENKSINYQKIIKKEKYNNCEEDILTDQQHHHHRMKNTIPMNHSKKGLQNSSNFNLSSTDFTGTSLGLQNVVNDSVQYFIQQAAANGLFIPNYVMPSCNNQYSPQLNLPNSYQPQQIPTHCNPPPNPLQDRPECDPHNNKNVAAIQTLCFMFLEDCKLGEKNSNNKYSKLTNETLKGECGYYTETVSPPINSIDIKTTSEEDGSYSDEDSTPSNVPSKIRHSKTVHPIESNDFSKLTHVKDETTSTSYLSINDPDNKYSFDKKRYLNTDKESQYTKSGDNNTSGAEKDEKNKENNVYWERQKQEHLTFKKKSNKNKNNKSPEPKENNHAKGTAMVYKIDLQQPDPLFSYNSLYPGIEFRGQTDAPQMMDSLSEKIFAFHTSVMQSQAHLNRKLYLRDMLYYTICPLFPTSGLYIVGSSLNGFGNNGSDMDLCLMLTNRELDQRRDAVAILNAIKIKMTSIEWIRDLHLIVAKVPILRITFNPPFSNITVDLNANNSVAIKNTHLLCAYSNFDWRVRPLVSAIKEWAKRRGINDANQSTFTSYSLVLMCLHYLQCGVDVPILPSLQEMYQDRFSNKCDVRNLNVVVSLEKPGKELWPYESKATLGELLLGFLKYYAETFDFEKDVISIRCGKKLSRKEVIKNDNSQHHLKSQWGCVCIEEPFTHMNTAHSVFDKVVFEATKLCFVETYDHLKNTSDFDVFLSGRSIKDFLAGYTLIPPGGVIYNAPRQNSINLFTSNSSTVYSSSENSLSNSSQEESSNELNTNTSEVLSDNSISKSSSFDDIEKKSDKECSINVSQHDGSLEQKKESDKNKICEEIVPITLKTGHLTITELGLSQVPLENNDNDDNKDLNIYGKFNLTEKSNNIQGTLTEQNKSKQCKKTNSDLSNSSVKSKGKNRPKKNKSNSFNNVDGNKRTISVEE